MAGLLNAPVVFELHDIWPLSLIDLYGFKTSNPFMKLIGAFERNAFTKAMRGLLLHADSYLKTAGYPPRTSYSTRLCKV
jgi:hypothetical protein